VQSDSPDIPVAGWGDVDQRLTKRMEAFLKSQPTYHNRPATASKKGIMRIMLQAMGAFLRRPAVGYVIALILSYPAYLGITSKLKPTIPSEAPRRTGASQPQSA